MDTTKIIANPGEQSITTEREFAAPPALLLRAYTEPDLVAQWLGPVELNTRVDHMDARDGGTWRYANVYEDGSEFGFHGVYHGTPSVAGIVQTFEFEGLPGHVVLETLTFEPRGDRTLVRTVSVFQSLADRDGMIASGMESGVVSSHDRLDALVARLGA
jgi:uncharacterized protein YndB with AHSA1/START domain